jgi:hypothetical protein
MLESVSLTISSWRPDPARDGQSRSIADGTTQAMLGLVHAPPSDPWLGWLRSRRLDVLEGEDAAFLMTLIRPWGLARAWRVYDAEERNVGTLHARQLVDSEGGARGFIDSAQPGSGCVLGPQSQTLAEYDTESDGTTRLQFAADLEANPFLRMLLLGAVVVRGGPPNS